MKNFKFYNPTRIIFGKGTIPDINNHIPKNARVLMCYGGGSRKCFTIFTTVSVKFSFKKMVFNH